MHTHITHTHTHHSRTQDLAPATASGNFAPPPATVDDSEPPQQLYLADRGAVDKAGAGALASVPKGAQAVAVQHVQTASGQPAQLWVMAERPRWVWVKSRRARTRVCVCVCVCDCVCVCV